MSAVSFALEYCFCAEIIVACGNILPNATVIFFLTIDINVAPYFHEI